MVVTSRVEGLAEIAKLKLKGIKVLEPPLLSLNLYHYLNKKHEKLAAKVIFALKDGKGGRNSEDQESVPAETITRAVIQILKLIGRAHFDDPELFNLNIFK